MPNTIKQNDSLEKWRKNKYSQVRTRLSIPLINPCSTRTPLRSTKGCLINDICHISSAFSIADLTLHLTHRLTPCTILPELAGSLVTPHLPHWQLTTSPFSSKIGNRSLERNTIIIKTLQTEIVL